MNAPPDLNPALARRIRVLAGDADWCRAQAARLPAGAEVLWLGQGAPEGVTASDSARAGRYLGREFDLLVFDAHAGFDADAFGAASGSVRGGGWLLLLTPPLEQWAAFADPERERLASWPATPDQVGGRFLDRLARVLAAEPALELVQAPAEIAPPGLRRPPVALAPPGGDGCRSNDQRAAVEALLHVVHGHRRRPLVLTSDRGRGKSAALGIAAARLLAEGHGRIVVTAPRQQATASLFEQAARLLPGAEVSRGRIRRGAGCLEFVAPDALLQGREHADLLLVDEAAAIPAPLLEQMLERHGRIAFATTVHGYEGTGRGFDLRFRRVLDARTPGWRGLRLETPIRWGPGDPLERLVFRALLLDAAPAADAMLAAATADACSLERLDRDALAADEALLGELFGLLVLAHYRTTPGDLRHLLDGPELSIYVLRHRGHVAATALVAREGGFDADLARAIWAGERRPRGNLIPQSLSAHAGLEQAARLGCARIQRIAVHPAVQGRGLGRRLVAAVSGDARAEGLDLVGASFGATPELVRFWAGCGLAPVRVGFSREASSGGHAVIMTAPLGVAGAALQQAAQARLAEQLPLLLGDPLQTLEPGVALELLQRASAPPSLTAAELHELGGFAFARRGFEASLVPLWRLTCRGLADPAAAAALPPAGRNLLLLRVLQRHPWDDCVQALGLAGRGEALELLRESVAALLRRSGAAP